MLKVPGTVELDEGTFFLQLGENVFAEMEPAAFQGGLGKRLGKPIGRSLKMIE